jgi:hypothetical protein
MRGETFRKVLAGLVVAGILFLGLDLLAAGGWIGGYELRGSDQPYRVTMCNQASGETGVCTDTGVISGGTARVHRFNGMYATTHFGTQSTATTYSCDLYGNDTGYDADAADRQVLNSTSLSQTNQAISFDGLFDYVWWECTAVTGGTVVITMLASAL